MAEPAKAELAVVEKQDKMVSRVANLNPRNFEEAWKLAQGIAKTQLCPPQFRGKPHDVFMCLQMGSELGLPPMQALSSIAVINSRASLYGDGFLAVIQSHRDYEWHKESISGEGDTRTATCTFKRRGLDPQTATFSVADAKRAKLWGKQGPWTEYPDRMLTFRARGFSGRNTFADALRGLILYEEAIDMPAPKVIEHATVDETAFLTQSSEPNRGHGAEGFEAGKVIEVDQPEKVVIAKPSETPIPAPTSPVPEKPVEIPVPEPERPVAAKESLPEGHMRVVYNVLNVQEFTIRGKKTKYLVMTVQGGSNITVFDKKLWEFCEKAVGKQMDMVISRHDSAGRSYWNLEQIHRVDTCAFVDNQPAGEAEEYGDQPTAQQLFPQEDDF